VGDHAVSALNIARRVTPAHPHPIRAATVRESVSAARPAPCAGCRAPAHPRPIRAATVGESVSAARPVSGTLPTALGGHAFRSVAFLDLVVYEGAQADVWDAT